MGVITGLNSGGSGSAGGGLCVFTCSTILSAFGAIAALGEYDLGAESAFFTVEGLGALCFAKCQYLRIAREKSERGQGLGGHGYEPGVGPSEMHFGGPPSFTVTNDLHQGGGGPGVGADHVHAWRRRREEDDKPEMKKLENNKPEFILNEH